MPTVPNGSLSLRCENLESRETPSVSETFDAARFPFTPNGWKQWANNGQEYYGTTRSAATSGTQSLALYGNLTVQSRLWNTTATQNNVTLWANVRSDTPAPVLVFGRGTELDTASASYVGLTVNSGGRFSVVESVNGQTRTVASLTARGSLPTTWLNVSMSMVGDRVNFRVVRLDTQQFLNASGQWQATETDAILGTVTRQSASGFSGIGRLPGNYGTAYVDDFAVTNSVATPVSPANSQQKYSHIRLAQLAYQSTPVGETERQLAANSVDLVIPSEKFLDTFQQASPNSNQLIYSNVSNVYLDLYLDWLSYADRTGANREAAFYHVTQATPFTGNSPSAVPVRHLWAASRGAANGTATLTDLTSHARGGRNIGVVFGAAGEAVNLGYAEKYRELNLTLTRSAQSGYTGVWEYVSATNASGQPTQWKTLPLLVDGTSRLTRNGQVSFDPPRDWAAATLNGTESRLFYVRYRTTAGTTAQAAEARTIFGRDFVNARGTSQGTIPAFDYTADRDGDGYLNDQEYGRRRAGLDARFVYETRLFYPFYGQQRYVVNPTSLSVKNWAADYHVRQLAKNPNADGLFLDNASGRLPFAGTSVIEPTGTFTSESAKLIEAVESATNKIVLANTSGGRTEANSIVAASGAALEEFLLRPNDVNWSGLNDVASVVNQRLNATKDAVVVLDSHPGSTANMTNPRTQIGALSYYYLLADPKQTYLMIWGGFSPSAGWSSKWIPAATTNVGQPKSSMTTFAEGKDPQNANLNFKVFSREYENALVLFKPRSYTLGRGTGTTDNATATTHQLNGNYRELRADGTLGPVVRQVTLRNGEGAVLMKA